MGTVRPYSEPGQCQILVIEMHRLNPAEWIDWFGALQRGQRVVLRSEIPGEQLTATGQLVTAEYAPFDDLVEVVVDTDRSRLRFWIDHPSEMMVDEGSQRRGWSIVIKSPDGVWRARETGSQAPDPGWGAN
jgi:hypothetical protein